MKTKNREDDKRVCDRCSYRTDELYPHEFTDDVGDKRKMKLCWNCDHDVMNGGEYLVDQTELLMEREEQEYYEDPINNSPPPWFFR